MTPRGLAVLIFFCACGSLIANVQAAFFFNIFEDFKDEMGASKARDLRAEIKYHYGRANDAQNLMSKAENENDVEEYEKWLQIMREEDAKMHKCADKYEELRDLLEAKIRMGELHIEGFKMRYDKGTLKSVIDHLTFRATY